MDRIINFEDAQQLAKKYPDTFYAPDESRLSQIKPGDFIKVCALNERFWVEVTAIENERIEGKVANDLLMDGLRFDDAICVEQRHVYDILSTPQSKKNIQVSKKGKGLR